ncbi:MAG: single-stranded DNA-binding protein [Victivallaceae bacterium]|nr:single-stranded DNA-binding protein [Victivallaceae bacterium]
MASLNKVFLLGNLTRSPELRYTPGGAAVCEFGLAVNRRYITNNQEKEETCFINIVVWGKQGESCQRFLEKGSTALVEGRLQYDQWDDRDTGKKRSTLRVVAERIQFIGGVRRDDGQGDYQTPSQAGYQASPGNYQTPPRGASQPPAGNPPGRGNDGFPEMPNDAFEVSDDVEDDIPF